MVVIRLRRWLAAVLAVGVAAVGPGAGSYSAVAGPATSSGAAQAASAAWGTGSTAAAATDYREVVETLEAEIPAMMREHGVVGATVALVAGDRVLLARGFGWADRARRRPVTARTLFHIGSLSKTFTAFAVMQLVEQGRVDLDAPITRYVPELRLLKRLKRHRITVRSVLDHHSGIPGDIFNGLITMERPDPSFRTWLLRTLRRMPPERRVNTVWAYNNSGYVLLQNLVENVTGQEFAYRTDRTLFRRMGMRSSSFDDTLAPDSAMTRNYVPVLGADGGPTGRVTVSPREYVNGWAAGSILSSAKDMAKYLRMLIRYGRGLNGRVVRPGTLRQMTTPQTHLPIDLGRRSGLGWARSDSWWGPAIFHDGATTRNFTLLGVLPAEGVGAFVSANTVGGDALSGAVVGRALELLYSARTGVPKPAPAVLPDRPERTPAAAELAAAEGRYAGASDYTTVEADGTRVQVTTVGPAGVVTMAYSAMAGGWWKTVENPLQQIRFRTIAGRHVLLARTGGGTQVRSVILGEKVPVAQLPRAWRRSFGTYRARLDFAHRTDVVPQQLRLEIVDGLAVLVMPMDRKPMRQVLSGFTADHAFTFGLSASGGRGKGDIVRLGRNTITHMGVVYRRVERRGDRP